MQDNDSIMVGFYCIAFTEYVVTGGTSSDYTDLFFPIYYKKIEKIIYKYLKDRFDKRERKP